MVKGERENGVHDRPRLPCHQRAERHRLLGRLAAGVAPGGSPLRKKQGISLGGIGNNV